MKSKTVPLERYPLCRSRNREEVIARVHERIGYRPIMATHKSARADIRMNCVYLPRMYLSYVQYGAAVEVHPPHPMAQYRLLLPLAGQVRSCVGDDSLVCDRNRAALTSPEHLWTARSNAQSKRLNLVIRQDAMTRRLAAVLGEAPQTPLVFRRDLDLKAGPGRSLASFIGWSIEQFDRDDILVRHPLMVSQFEDWILTALLTQLPHNYRDALEGGGSAVPRDLKRTIDYIRAHADQAITTEDLVAVSGVAGRTLYRHFRDVTGLSPMAYLRKVRFEQVRAELQQASPSHSITDLALKWGFRHAGRFSVEYRRIFGESPSETAGRRGPR